MPRLDHQYVSPHGARYMEKYVRHNPSLAIAESILEERTLKARTYSVGVQRASHTTPHRQT